VNRIDDEPSRRIMSSVSFTTREMDVMSVLWNLGSATVAEVRERIADPLAYTTILSVLQTLEEKGHVRHEEEGRAYRYYPLVDWQTAGGSELKRLLGKVFKGSPELLLVQLVEDEALSEEQLRRIQDLVEERLQGGRGDGEEEEP
jgi:BlaI family transcriptional regulator, penicillinase repressor